MKIKFRQTVLLVGIVLLLTSCADTQPHAKECVTGHIYGFWAGLWHGIIAPFAFIGSLIYDDIAVYAPNNNGAWYCFGFLWGIGCLLGGSTTVKK